MFRFAIVSIVFLIIMLFIYFLFNSTRPLYYGAVSDHFDGKKFHNYDHTEGVFTLADILKWQYYELTDDHKAKWPKFIDDVDSEAAKVEEHVYGNKIKLTFINHATFLIQYNGINIITDPLLSKRVSPIKWLGPKRYRKAGIDLKNLPPIDYIVVSHDHYDHCDIRTIKKIVKKWGSKVISGLGMKSFLKPFGIEVQELDWWQSIDCGSNVKINFVPAVHWSGRYGLLGNNRTLWGGFVITTKLGGIYFSGDTAFGKGDVFQMIKDHYQNFRAALLPIGAYEPRWFMSRHHINPEEAVKIHKIIKPKQTIAMHFGTFALSSEGEGAPEKELRASMERYMVTKQELLIPKQGESFILY